MQPEASWAYLLFWLFQAQLSPCCSDHSLREVKDVTEDRKQMPPSAYVCVMWSQDTLILVKVAFSESKMQREKNLQEMPCFCSFDLLHFIRNLLFLGRTIEATVSLLPGPRPSEEGRRPCYCSSLQLREGGEQENDSQGKYWLPESFFF